MPSFHVDGRIAVRMEFDFAVRLGEFILAQGTEDKQFQAFAHQLVNLESNVDVKNSPQIENMPKATSSEWSEKPNAMHEKVFTNRSRKIRWGHAD
jgi:hypothetical protein